MKADHSKDTVKERSLRTTMNSQNPQSATPHYRTTAMPRVVVAMSGGVDSSLAAALLKEQGYEVIGVMMRLWAEVSTGVGSSNKCCSIEAVSAPAPGSRPVGHPLLPDQCRAAVQGAGGRLHRRSIPGRRDAQPCIQCNRHIRFDYLYNYAMSLGAHYLATGHYARVRQQVSGVTCQVSSMDKSARSDHYLWGSIRKRTKAMSSMC